MSSCNGVDIGVDLNRNYSFKFNYDDSGSTNGGCNQDYRGPNAFSEPETRAMRDLVNQVKNVKIALNLHAFGSPAPLWIHPFCFTPDRSNQILKNDFPIAQ